MPEHYPNELLERINSVTANRAKTMLLHILEHGSITTEELASLYGYNHPPRAARDVREHGIPLKMERVHGQSGRSIASYSIDVEEFIRRRVGRRIGRRAFPALWKRNMAEERGRRCEVCLTVFDSDVDLQVDHRVPYEIGGDPPLEDMDAFMLVCPPCNRQKSWRCEHCPNWEQRQPEICEKCFWASPSSYTHVAMANRLVIVVPFSDQEQELYQSLEKESKAKGVPVVDLVKEKLKEEH